MTTELNWYDVELSRMDKLLKGVRIELNQLTLFMAEKESIEKHKTVLANISELLGENGY